MSDPATAEKARQALTRAKKGIVDRDRPDRPRRPGRRDHQGDGAPGAGQRRAQGQGLALPDQRDRDRGGDPAERHLRDRPDRRPRRGRRARGRRREHRAAWPTSPAPARRSRPSTGRWSTRPRSSPTEPSPRAPAPRPGRQVRPVDDIVLMGVAGAGKSTVMAELAGRLGWRTLEGDAIHPPANVAKMAAGRPLTDEDREPWLAAIAAWIGRAAAAGEPVDRDLLGPPAALSRRAPCRRRGRDLRPPRGAAGGPRDPDGRTGRPLHAARTCSPRSSSSSNRSPTSPASASMRPCRRPRSRTRSWSASGSHGPVDPS